MFRKILLIATLFRCLSTSAQYLPTPNASNLIEAGIPSNNTGLADISIPLYHCKERGISLSLELFHHSAGVQLNRLPGWTGHNWALSAGGVITREVRGQADEYTGNQQSCYFDAQEILNSPILPSLDADLEPDIFHFNFMGMSGKFFLDHDGQWKVISSGNFDVLLNVKDKNNFHSPSVANARSINGFTLRDPQGVCYEFGINTDAIEYNFNLANGANSSTSTSFMASAWYLTKIVDRHGNPLYTFTYERGCYLAQFYNEIKTIPASGNPDIQASAIGLLGTFYIPTYLRRIQTLSGIEIQFQTEDSPVSGPALYPTIGQRSDWHTLKSKTSHLTAYDKGCAWGNFPLVERRENPLLSTRLRELQKIHISCPSLNEKNGAAHDKTIHLAYDYDSRMHLAQISIDQGDEPISYNFCYNQYDRLPADYLTTQVDQWGYYNGQEKSPNAANYAPTSWQVAPTPSAYGLLKGIVNPHGGNTIYEYEQNSYAHYLSEYRDEVLNAEDGEQYCGGYRIKTISVYNDNTPEAELLDSTAFSYANPLTGKSSGELRGLPAMENSIFPYSNAMRLGPSFGYSYVMETLADGTSTRYIYTNFSDTRRDTPPISISGTTVNLLHNLFSERGYLRGNLIAVENYDSSGNKLSSTSRIYRNLNECEERYSRGANIYKDAQYKIFYPRYDVIEERDTLFTGNGPLVSQKLYDRRDTTLTINLPYPHETYVRLTHAVKQLRGTQWTEERYLYGFSSNRPARQIPDWNAPTDSIDGSNNNEGTYPYCYAAKPEELHKEQFLLTPVAIEKYNNETLVSRTSTNYHWWQFARFAKPLLLPSSYMESRGETPADTLAHYMAYTPTGQLAMYREQGEPLTQLLWGKNEASLMATYQANTPLQLDMSHLDVDDEHAVRQFFQNVRENSPGQLTSYTRHPMLGVTSTTSPAGITTYYDFGNDGLRLRRIKNSRGQTIQKFDYHYRK